MILNKNTTLIIDYFSGLNTKAINLFLLDFFVKPLSFFYMGSMSVIPRFVRTVNNVSETIKFV